MVGAPVLQLGDTFMQGNARVNKFGSTTEWLMGHGIWICTLPGSQPDRACQTDSRGQNPSATQFQSLKDHFAKQVCEARSKHGRGSSSPLHAVR
jgi:hypothetical protein